MGAAERKAPPAAPRLRFPHLPQSGACWVTSSSCQMEAREGAWLRQFLQVPAQSSIHSSKGYAAPSLGAARSFTQTLIRRRGRPPQRGPTRDSLTDSSVISQYF